ncbi:hypothetical protein ATCC90586_003410 [Pythium insidiosum]|nr:hypothetical protein ATCC90586_003410 [Pythium insidiosum]
MPPRAKPLKPQGVTPTLPPDGDTGDPASTRPTIEPQPPEFSKIVPFVWSWPRWLLFWALVVLSGGIVWVIACWFPRVYTGLARSRLPLSSIGDAHYVLLLDSQDDEWVEVRVHQPKKPSKRKKAAAKAGEEQAPTTANTEQPKPDADADADGDEDGDGDGDGDGDAERATPSLWKRLCSRQARSKPPTPATVKPVKSGSKKMLKRRAKALRKRNAWIWFEFRCHRYVYNNDSHEFERYLAVLDESLDTLTQTTVHTGLSAADHAKRLEVFGPNSLALSPATLAQLLLGKLVHPFYLLQVFSLALWYTHEEWARASVVLGLSLASVLWELGHDLRVARRQRLLARSVSYVEVLRSQPASAEPSAQLEPRLAMVSERDVVPGDILVLKTGVRVVADLVLLSGRCEVDEAEISGVAQPKWKTPAATGERVTAATAPDAFSASFLPAGAVVGRVEDGTNGCKAVVVSTGFSTARGEVLRTVVTARVKLATLERDMYRYLFVLSLFALGAFIERVLVRLLDLGQGMDVVAVDAMDLVAIAVPPALPLVLTTVINLARRRLTKRGVVCTDSQRLHSFGSLSLVCLDKTGTLTQRDLCFTGGFIPSHPDNADVGHRFVPASDLVRDETASALRFAMASCHELTWQPNTVAKDAAVDANDDAPLDGYPVDLAMFRAAQIRFMRPETSDARHLATFVTRRDDEKRECFNVLARLPFESARQLASVVVESSADGRRYVCTKGAPETIAALVLPSTLPRDFDRVQLASSASCYTLAFAIKELPSGGSLAVSRAELESSLTYVGLATFADELRPEAPRVVATLHNAGLASRVLTGDAPLAAARMLRAMPFLLRWPKISIIDFVDDDVRYLETPLEVSLDTAALFADTSATARPEDVALAFQDVQWHWESLAPGMVSRLLAEHDVIVTGRALEMLRGECSAETIALLVSRTVAFARLRPAQKTWLVTELKRMGHVVAMVGDGINDVGAVHAAHVGLSLSRRDETAAIAPFVSKEPDLEMLLALLMQGRNSQTTTFVVFKFLALFPMVQLAMLETVGFLNVELSTNQLTWSELAIALALALSMALTRDGAATTLTIDTFPKNLFSPRNFWSVFVQLGVFLVFFVGHLVLLNGQNGWFCSASDGVRWLEGERAFVPSACAIYGDFNTLEHVGYSFEGTCIWLFGNLQILAIAAAFVGRRDGPPGQRNAWFAVLWVALVGVNVWFVFDSKDTVASTFELMPVPMRFRWRIFVLFLGHLVAALLGEMLVSRAVAVSAKAKQTSVAKSIKPVVLPMPESPPNSRRSVFSRKKKEVKLEESVAATDLPNHEQKDQAPAPEDETPEGFLKRWEREEFEPTLLTNLPQAVLSDVYHLENVSSWSPPDSARSFKHGYSKTGTEHLLSVCTPPQAAAAGELDALRRARWVYRVSQLSRWPVVQTQHATTLTSRFLGKNKVAAPALGAVTFPDSAALLGAYADLLSSLHVLTGRARLIHRTLSLTRDILYHDGACWILSLNDVEPFDPSNSLDMEQLKSQVAQITEFFRDQDALLAAKRLAARDSNGRSLLLSVEDAMDYVAARVTESETRAKAPSLMRFIDEVKKRPDARISPAWAGQLLEQITKGDGDSASRDAS